jgi:uncharacterized protein with ParB-like and HNH nuclease domain/predicted transport protein
MKAKEAKFINFLRNSPQFVIPIYQRTYSWTEKECRQLWSDIVRTGSNDEISAHFVGSVVYIEQGLYQVSSQPQLLVIDGQQRLTTVSLILAALALAVGDGEPFDGFSARKIRNWYLVNPEEDGDRHFKLMLSQTDRESLLALLKGLEQPQDSSIRIRENFELFTKLIDSSKDDLASVCKGIAKLMLVDIALTREQDNPQLIFESMNSTGKELSQADLIRNFILMGLDPEDQTYLYEKYWRPMENDFGQKAYQDHFDAFMRHYLTVKTGDIPRINEVYEAFKRHSINSDGMPVDIEKLVADIREYAHFYCAMALGTESDQELALAFQDLRELRVDVAYPLLLEMYNDFATHALTHVDFLTAVRLVESYVFRRVVCSIPTNSLNKTFSTFKNFLNKERYLESLLAQFLLLPSYRRFPNDEEFKRYLEISDMYNLNRRNYWLRRLENHGRKERVEVSDYTIEHIMPQNENVSEEWQSDLGDDWESVHSDMLHTLGNLTLTGYNSEYSDHAFAKKRDMPGGFAESPLKLNKGLGSLKVWNSESMRNRASELSSEAVKVWPLAILKEETLDLYRPQVKEVPHYTLEDHPYLANGKNRQLFDAFQDEALALDPNVREEILKQYIAFKAETNFADVVPMASKLRIYLNMPYSEINDPRGITNDVTGAGNWGNGDVEIEIHELSQLPSIMGLVRQSFERQMELAE